MPKPKPKFRSLFHAVAEGAFNTQRRKGLVLLGQLSGNNGAGTVKAPKPPIQKLTAAQARAFKKNEKALWGAKPAFAKRVEAIQRKAPDSQHHSGPKHPAHIRHPDR